MRGTAWFDGACSGNPGPMGAGAVIDAEGTVEEVSLALGRGTNNEAEYHAVIAALRHALAAGITDLTLSGDSQLVLRQLEGRYQVKAANLQALHAEATRLMRTFGSVRLAWVPRAENARADALARRGAGT